MTLLITEPEDRLFVTSYDEESSTRTVTVGLGFIDDD